MTSPTTKTPPVGRVPQEEFFGSDARRQHSHIQSYGSEWNEADWTDVFARGADTGALKVVLARHS
jgi:hypothetical protein